MSDQADMLFERVEKVIAQSKSLVEENRVHAARARAWLQRLYWLAEEASASPRRKAAS